MTNRPRSPETESGYDQEQQDGNNRENPIPREAVARAQVAGGGARVVVGVFVGEVEPVVDRLLAPAGAFIGAAAGAGVGAGRDVTALLSDMNQPLGAAVGNAIEVAEAVETASQRGWRRPVLV